MINYSTDKLLSDIIEASGIHPSRVFNVVVFGSRVYGTNRPNSDWDIIMVANNSVEAVEVSGDIFNIHIYTPDRFKRDLEWHRPNNLECIFAPEWAILKESIDYRNNFTLNIPRLRHATSQISSNSWVKSKKKLELTKEYTIGIKSLFHSLRIPMFSIQIVELGYVKDFECANWIWEKIISKNQWEWLDLDMEFRGLRNGLLSDFRKITRK